MPSRYAFVAAIALAIALVIVATAGAGVGPVVTTDLGSSHGLKYLKGSYQDADATYVVLYPVCNPAHAVTGGGGYPRGGVMTAEYQAAFPYDDSQVGDPDPDPDDLWFSSFYSGDTLPALDVFSICL